MEMGRLERPNSETQRAERNEFLGMGCSPLHQLKGLGKLCKLPRWGPKRSPGELAI